MIKELTALGLNDKEAKIYAAAVELGTTTIAEIASKSGLKRPTVYTHVEDMVKNGLLERVRMNKKVLYKPADPAYFEKKLETTKNAIEEIKQTYALGQLHSGKPQVQVYEGLENVRRIYDEMGEENSLRFWSNVEGVQPFFHKDWTRLVENFNKNQTTVREIVADNKDARRMARYIKGIIGPTYTARVATIDGLYNDGAVSSKALYIFRLNEFNFYVVRIEDATIASTYRALFDMAWKTAKSL